MKRIGIVSLMVLLLSSLFAQQEKVRLEKNKIYLGEKQILRKEYKALIKNNEEAMSHLRQQATANAFSYSFAFIGGFGLGYGAGGLLFNNDPRLKTMHAAMLGGGVFLGATAFILEAVGKSSLKKSMNIYNGNPKPITFNLKAGPSEIGLVAQF